MADATGKVPSLFAQTLEKLDARWTSIDARLCTAILVGEISAMVVWVSLKGLSAGTLAPGRAFRLLFAVTLGAAAAHLLLRRQKPWVHRAGVLFAMAGSAMLARRLGQVGIFSGSNLLGWLQNSSVFALFGGLRGIVTRLTLWVALVGASLATAGSKHIHIDLLTRYLPRAVARRVSSTLYLLTSVVCFAAAVGFVDSIAVTKYGAEAFVACGEGKLCDTPVQSRLAAVARGMRTDWFVLRSQLSLDMGAALPVLLGNPYDKSLTNAAWNAWLRARESDFQAHFSKEVVQQLYAPSEDGHHPPALAIPGLAQSGLITRDLNFVFPIGLLLIGIRFVLRGILRWMQDDGHDTEVAS